MSRVFVVGLCVGMLFVAPVFADEGGESVLQRYLDKTKQTDELAYSQVNLITKETIKCFLKRAENGEQDTVMYYASKRPKMHIYSQTGNYLLLPEKILKIEFETRQYSKAQDVRKLMQTYPQRVSISLLSNYHHEVREISDGNHYILSVTLDDKLVETVANDIINQLQRIEKNDATKIDYVLNFVAKRMVFWISRQDLRLVAWKSFDTNGNLFQSFHRTDYREELSEGEKDLFTPPDDTQGMIVARSPGDFDKEVTEVIKQRSLNRFEEIKNYIIDAQLRIRGKEK